MKILVTGANSLLGTNAIKELLHQSHEVIGLLRNKNCFALPKHNHLQLFECDYCNDKELNSRVKDCDIIVHIAGETSHALLGYDDYIKTNIILTQKLIDAAIQFKVKRFIFISSANTIGHGTADDPGNETRIIKKPFVNSYYAQSKLEAQNLVLSVKDKIDVVVLNPTFVLGAYDSKPSSGKIIMIGYKKQLVFCPPGGKNIVNATDVAKAIIASIKFGQNGEMYLIAYKNISYRNFYKKMAQLNKYKTVCITVPKFVLLILGKFGDLLRWFGLQTQNSSNNAQIVCTKNYYSNKKSITELKMNYTSINYGILDAIAWFKKVKMIK